jgi:uncharacterized sulfatase
MRSAAVPPPYVTDLGEYLAAAGYYTVKREKSDYTISATPTEDDNGAHLSRIVPLGAWDERPSAQWRRRAPGQPFFAVISPQVIHESRVFMPAEQFARETAHVKLEDRHDPAKATLPPYYPDTLPPRQALGLRLRHSRSVHRPLAAANGRGASAG